MRHRAEAWLRTGRRLARGPLVALHLFVWLVTVLFLRRGRDGVVPSRPLSIWSGTLCRLMGVTTVVQGRPCTGSVLLVANHVSWLDVFCLASVAPTHFLAKAEVLQWPLIGWLARRSGTAFIRRGSENGAGEASEQLAWRLRRGGRVLLFPEGTSTAGDTVRHFHPRLFQAAIHARCTVQPVALRYSHRAGVHPDVPFVGDMTLLPHLWRLLGEASIVAELTFCPPVSAAGRTRDALSTEARDAICGALGLKDTAPEAGALARACLVDPPHARRRVRRSAAARR